MKHGKYVFAVIAVIAAVLVFSCGSSGGGGGNAAVAVEPFRLSFDDPESVSANWTVAIAEFWDHKGTVEISRDDTTLGKPMLRMDVDFTKDTGSEWSEPKLGYKLSEPFVMAGYKNFVFDIIYNPEFSTKGHFKSKFLFMNDNKKLSECQSDHIKGEEMDNGFIKATVSLRLTPRTSNAMNNMIFAIAGYKTDYKGPVFFDNIRWE
ncbi:MAG: hypothetical protein LBH44_12305 [Treponema sp.]|jgi:hypothetical protein|nr:hypothetical protein [Treponema sp.]